MTHFVREPGFDERLFNGNRDDGQYDYVVAGPTQTRAREIEALAAALGSRGKVFTFLSTVPSGQNPQVGPALRGAKAVFVFLSGTPMHDNALLERIVLASPESRLCVFCFEGTDIGTLNEFTIEHSVHCAVKSDWFLNARSRVSMNLLQTRVEQNIAQNAGQIVDAVLGRAADTIDRFTDPGRW